jgi:3-hydroxyisobutyrate dehydrogenase-like beta-hydroxyacid dehydrogenase
MIASDTTSPSGSVTARRDSRVGVIGLGHMGHAFAVNLVADGYKVFVYDQDAKRAATLIGASPAARLGDLAACNVVLTSLPDDDALAEVALGPEGLAAILKSGAVHISTSTVSPGMSRRVAEEHARHGQGYIAAPVLGTRISPGQGSSSYWPPDHPRRWMRCGRCSSASVSVCS